MYKLLLIAATLGVGAVMLMKKRKANSSEQETITPAEQQPSAA